MIEKQRQSAIFNTWSNFADRVTIIIFLYLLAYHTYVCFQEHHKILPPVLCYTTFDFTPYRINHLKHCVIFQENHGILNTIKISSQDFYQA